MLRINLQIFIFNWIDKEIYFKSQLLNDSNNSYKNHYIF